MLLLSHLQRQRDIYNTSTRTLFHHAEVKDPLNPPLGGGAGSEKFSVLSFPFVKIHPLRASRSSRLSLGAKRVFRRSTDVLLCPLRGAISIATLGGRLARCYLL